jgi:protein phosphatase 1 regulatory subunit 10
MDLYSAPSWLQHQPQPQQHSPESHHEGRPLSADAWKERASSAGTTAGVTQSPTTSQTTLDLSDFTNLADVPGEHVLPSAYMLYVTRSRDKAQVCDAYVRLAAIPHPTSVSPPAQPFFGSFQHNGFFLQSPTASYNVMPYGSSGWNQTPQLPLSNYSSLNGATSSAAGASQPQLSQQSPPQQQQMMIE